MTIGVDGMGWIRMNEVIRMALGGRVMGMDAIRCWMFTAVRRFASCGRLRIGRRRRLDRRLWCWSNGRPRSFETRHMAVATVVRWPNNS